MLKTWCWSGGPAGVWRWWGISPSRRNCARRPPTATCWSCGPDLPADEAARVLPPADVVALTAASLINHTIDDLLALCRPDAYVVLMGPSTPLWPGLFERGVHRTLRVDVLAGSLVTDIETVLRAVGQGATFRQLKRAGIRLVTMFDRSLTS